MVDARLTLTDSETSGHDVPATYFDGDARAVALMRGVHGDFFVPRRGHFAKKIAEFGTLARSELAFLRSIVRPGDVVVDVGAHIGTFAIPLALAVGPAGRVVAFEPNAAVFRLLEMNTVLNGLDHIIRTVPTGLDRAPRRRHLVQRRRSNSGFVALEEPATPWPIDEPPGLVETTTLDDWRHDREEMGPVDVIKIDVEGMEAAVIDGALLTIKESRPILFVELASQLSAAIGESAVGAVRALSDLDYRFARNLAPRDCRDDTFEMAWVGLDELLELLDADSHLDVMCVPPERTDRLER